MTRLRVAFFQRMFASYQAGLMKELAASSEHSYRFFGEDRDPLETGIEPVGEDERRLLRYTVCRTRHWSRHIACQWKAVETALFGTDDVIILEGGCTILTNWPAIAIARWRRKHVLLYTHGWLHRETGMRKYLKNTFYRLADGLLLYGNKARQIGLEYGFPLDRLYVAYNSLDDQTISRQHTAVSEARCAAFRQSLFGDASADPMIVSVGRLTAVKRYPLLIDAVAVLRGRGVPVTVLLVGDGPERALLAAQAAACAVPLALPGARYDEAYLGVCLSAAAMTVVPGAAGLSVIHSLSYGTPVVVHNDDDDHMPEHEAVEDGFNGARFRAGDAEDLARAIEHVLHDLPRGPDVARHCRSVVENAYSPKKMRQVFDAAVSGRPASELL
jgi:glycosyltransferase involved in cell wall biosynthesis